MESGTFMLGATSYIETIAKGIVSNPQEVTVNFKEGEKTIIIELKAAKEDTGRVIGRGGDIIRSIEALVDVYCRTHCPDKHCIFNFVREDRVNQKPTGGFRAGNK